MNKITLLTVLVVSVMSVTGCAQPTFTKQRFKSNLRNGNFDVQIVNEVPWLVTCYGGDRRTIRRALDKAIMEAIADVASYMPDTVTLSEYNAYVSDWEDQFLRAFFRDNSQRFTVDSLSIEQAKDCLDNYENYKGFMPKAEDK